MRMFEGRVLSTSMKNTIVVEVTRYISHPLYKKLLKRSKNYKAETKGIVINVGDLVKITEIKPISKDKHFVISSSVVARETLNKKSVTTEAVKKSEAQKIRKGRKV